jgi:hypothetical protein
MMKEELDPSMFRGSATTSSSNSTDRCVLGVLTSSGVTEGDSEYIEENDDIVRQHAYLANERMDWKRENVLIVTALLSRYVRNSL